MVPRHTKEMIIIVLVEITSLSTLLSGKNFFDSHFLILASKILLFFEIGLRNERDVQKNQVGYGPRPSQAEGCSPGWDKTRPSQGIVCFIQLQTVDSKAAWG
jgi:hypothetical protein